MSRRKNVRAMGCAVGGAVACWWGGLALARDASRCGRRCPGGRRGTCGCMTVHDFDGAGPEPARLIVAQGWNPCIVWAFDGRVWRQLGGIFGSAPNALLSHDPDGAGPVAPELYAGGSFLRDQGTGYETVVRLGWLGLGARGGPDRHGVRDVQPRRGRGGPGEGRAVRAATSNFIVAGRMRVLRLAGSGWIEIGNARTSGYLCLASFDEDGRARERRGCIAAGSSAVSRRRRPRTSRGGTRGVGGGGGSV